MIKNWRFLLFVAILLLFGALGLLGQLRTPPIPSRAADYLMTPSYQWQELRSLAAVDQVAATDLTAVDLDWSTIVVSEATVVATNGMIDVLLKPGWGANGATIAFYSDAADAANDTFGFELYAYGDGPTGPPIPIYITATNGCLMGSAICAKNPISGEAITGNAQWCDTIVGADCWPTGVSVGDSGNDRIASLTFDLMGTRTLRLLILGDDSGTQCAKVGAIIRYY